MKALAAAIVLLATTSISLGTPRADKLIVHEWGTFTSLQDETGRSVGGLNSSDEPLPSFVHRLRQGLIVNDDPFSKGITRAHPDVTLRLETPVIYFHPANSLTQVKVDVLATFRGGLLSEFYPNATAGTNDLTTTRITPETRGTLSWKSVHIGGDVKLPVTSSHVWLAPRQADAAPVTVRKESEKYLFYRGVGNVDAPLRVRRRGDEITIAERQPNSMNWGPMWLAEFHADGTCAFRTVAAAPARNDDAPSPQPAIFKSQEFSRDSARMLRAEMRQALIRAGLFPDESDAMLDTWQRSYFQGVGQRLFFIVPRSWTDQVLPLKISAPAEVELTRVMVGRIELVTPQVRQDLAAMSRDKTEAGQVSDCYADLGRFADALILDSLRAHPSPRLFEFASSKGIVPAPPANPASSSDSSPHPLVRK
jgi:hypothetical protein